MTLPNIYQSLLYAEERRNDLLREAAQNRLIRQVNQSRTKRLTLCQSSRTVAIAVSIALALGSLLFVASTMLAATMYEDAPVAQLYLPIVAGPAATTPTPTATATPTETPTTVPTETPPADSGVNGFFVETAWKTTNANIQVDANGGMHVAYAYYEPNTGTPPIGAVYLYCAVQCEQDTNWSNIWFQDEVNEVQLALTADGQPRLLLRTTSTVQNGGRDYQYAECNTNCTTAENWTGTLVLTSYGTDIFDVNDDDLPQRSFALDSQGRPAFLYLDRNYPIEPDHYGFYYVVCNSNCTDAANWTQTLVTTVIQEEYFFDWEVAQYPSLTFTSDGQPRFIAELILLGEQDRATALNYFACDDGCDDHANWRLLRKSREKR